jgi:hypothetical protein
MPLAVDEPVSVSISQGLPFSSGGTMSAPGWSPAEKRIANEVFEAAAGQEIGEIVTDFQKRAANIKSSNEMWSLEKYLRDARRDFEVKYDYRYSVLIRVFGRLLAEHRIAEQDLTGLSRAKLEEIRAFAEAWATPVRRR